MDKQKKKKIENEKESSEPKKPVIFDPEDPAADLEDLLEQLQKEYNLDKKDIKVVQFRKRKMSTKEILLSVLFGFLLDLVIIVALNGYLKFTNFSVLNITLFSLFFTVIETTLRQILMKYVFRLMLMSFGLISIPITIISFVLAILIVPGFVVENTGKLILFFIIFMVMRLTIRMFMMRRNLLKQRGNKNV